MFPRLTEICIWNRTESRAYDLVSLYEGLAVNFHVVQNLESAVAAADIISCATLSSEPIVHGAWVKPGTHVDLIGAFKPDMREADDALLQNADIYVDCRDTTLDHIGELSIPIKNGIISRQDILGDLYALCAGQVTRQSDSATTVFKNGGGAHLDLMIADYIVRIASYRRA